MSGGEAGGQGPGRPCRSGPPSGSSSRGPHASGGDVDAAITAYHEAETALDEGRIALEGHAIQSERARASADAFMQQHHRDLIADLAEPATERALAKKLDLATQLVAVEAELSAIRSEAARYISASGHSPQGNVPTPDALSEVMPVLQDIASGPQATFLSPARCRMGAPQRARAALQGARPRGRAAREQDNQENGPRSRRLPDGQPDAGVGQRSG